MSLDALRQKRVVVLPDLFIDALAFLPEWRDTRERLDAIAARGGGNMPIGPVEFKLGGNAANLALALARLGAKVELIAATDHLGLTLLQRAALGTGLGISRVRIGSSSSATLGLECKGSNVMLSHAGPLLDFGPEQLEPEDWDLLEDADAVAFVNWSQNRRGTAMLAALSERLRKRGVFLYLDTGDCRHRGDVGELLAHPTLWSGVGAFAMNENELRAFTGADGDLPAAAKALAARLRTRVDLHTRTTAVTVHAGQAVEVTAEATPAKRLTGAGDAWNAGNLAGHVLGWPDARRLELAHQVATAYVTGDDGLPPTPAQLVVAPS